MEFPKTENSWTTGTILASLLSGMSLLSMLGSIIWFSSHVNDAIAEIAPVAKEQQADHSDIVTLKVEQQYTDTRYAEIMVQLGKIDEKLNDSRRK